MQPLETEIARQCGCLPLALRAAASLLRQRKDMNAQDLYARLQDACKLLALKDTSRDLTVEAALQASCDLLGADLQQKWRWLAVFPGAFDAAAAAAVWQAQAEDAGDALGALLGYSLLEYDDKTRRWSLHDVIRLFAGRQLSKQESGRRPCAMREHYV